MPLSILYALLFSFLSILSVLTIRLREHLKQDAASQSTCLRNRFELLLPLLKYSTSDIETVANEGEFTRRKVSPF
jgi:hypothetical protein